MVDEKYLSIKEAAERLGVNEKTVYKYLREGRLKGEKNPVGGKWLRIKESDMEVFITGKPMEVSEKSSEKEEENDAVLRAEEAVRIAKANKERVEFEAAGATAQLEKDAATLGMTLEKYRVSQENALKLNAKYEAELLVQKERDDEREREKVVWSTHNKALEEQLEVKDSNEFTLKEEVLRLRGLIGEKEEQAVIAEEDKDYYKKNITEAIEVLNAIADGIKEYSPELTMTLEKQIALLNGKKDFKQGKQIIMGCHTAIVTTAGYFQDNKFRGFEGDVVANWLYEWDERLERLMQLKVEEATSDEPPMFTPPASTGFGRFLDRIAETINEWRI